MLFVLLNTIRVIFNKNTIDKKKKLACTKSTKISSLLWQSLPSPVTLSSDKHHNEPIYKYKVEKRLSVHPSHLYLAISSWIGIKFARNETPVLKEHGVHF